MVFKVNINFRINLKEIRKTKEIKKKLNTIYSNENYHLIHQLISHEEYHSAIKIKAAKKILTKPRIITLLNKAFEHHSKTGDHKRAFDCIVQSLNLRIRQKENIDQGILRQIEHFEWHNALELARKGYEGYKHTRYLAIQALLESVLTISPNRKCISSIKEKLIAHSIAGKLKGFYSIYITHGAYQDTDISWLVFRTIEKGIRDPLIQRIILKVLTNTDKLNIKPSNHHTTLLISTVAESGKQISNFDIRSLLRFTTEQPNHESSIVLNTIRKTENVCTYEEIESDFYQLKLASSRSLLIRLLIGTKGEFAISQLAYNAYKWKSSILISKTVKALFDSGKYNVIIDIYERLDEIHKQHKQIFNFYIGALRASDDIVKAKKILANAPDSIPDIIILIQNFFIHKKENKILEARKYAFQVYKLQVESKKERWARSIVETYINEWDFESAFNYVKNNPQHSKSLLPLIHFRQSTLENIESDLKSRISEGEENNDIHYYLSYLYCERKEYTKAIKEITHATNLKVSKRNSLFYILLKTVVSNDYSSCLTLITKNKLDSNILFAKHRAYLLLKLGMYNEADKYLNENCDIFNATDKGRIERLLLLSNSARLSGKHQDSFKLFSSIFPNNQRCFSSLDKSTHSFSVANLKSTATVNILKTEPLVSVIMTNFGWAEHTTASIQSILDQTYCNIELIIIDDHSESNSYRKLAKFVRNKKDKRIKLKRLKQNSGTYRAKNIGIKLAKGNYITFQDSDDWSHPNRLTEQFTTLTKNKKVHAVITRYLRVNPSSLAHFQNSEFCRKAFITLMIRKSLIDTLGFFDSVRTSADSELINRIEAATSSKLEVIEKPLYIASYHDRSLTSHGEFSLDPLLGVVGHRKKYQSSFKKWHKKIVSGASPYIPLTHKKRIFPCPPALIK